MKKFLLSILFIFSIVTCCSCSFSANKVMPAPQWKIKNVRLIDCDNMISVALNNDQISSFCKLANKISYDSSYTILFETDFMVEITYKILFWDSCELMLISNGRIYNEYGDMTNNVQTELSEFLEQTYQDNFSKLLQEF